MINNKTIQHQLLNLINGLDEITVLGFLSKYFGYIPFRGDDCRADLLRKLIEMETNKERNEALLNIAYDFDSNTFGLRVCSTCGNFMTEGYYLAGEYACNRDCAIMNYMDSAYNHSENVEISYEEAERLLDNDLEFDAREDAGEVYWTSWID